MFIICHIVPANVYVIKMINLIRECKKCPKTPVVEAKPSEQVIFSSDGLFKVNYCLWKQIIQKSKNTQYPWTAISRASLSLLYLFHSQWSASGLTIRSILLRYLNEENVLKAIMILTTQKMVYIVSIRLFPEDKRQDFRS